MRYQMLWMVIGCGLCLSSAGAQPGLKVQNGRAARFAVSPPLTQIVNQASIKAASAQSPSFREIPRGDLPSTLKPKITKSMPSIPDPVHQKDAPSGTMPEPLLTFEGISSLDSVAPPDPSGDVGPNHYVEMVNMHFCIYDKLTGTNLIEPMLMSTLFAAGGFPPPASTIDDGDPIVLYDPLANRWMISQFIVSVTPCHEVIAISQTADPTGAWYLYDFVMPNNKMNDYPKFGVWPDGYYMTDNQFDSSSWGGVGVFAFDRTKMLAGDPSATYQYFDLYTTEPMFSGLLPSDLDGPPPPAGTPNYFAMMDDESLNPFDALYVWKFHVDWDNPANSTFGNNGMPDYTNQVASFNSIFPLDRNSISQPGTTQRLDPIGDRLMFRLQYRNFTTHESLVVCHTVNVGNNNQAGVRYYELRRPLPGGTFQVQEQATFAPDTENRWMGSAAMDGQGNLAVGYSVSSTNVYPSIRYAGRRASDPSNGLFLGEASMLEGTHSQTGVNRWGDYTTLSVDPVDDSTFWFVSQYSGGGWNWGTRIGSFRISGLHLGSVEGLITNALTGAGIPDATLQFSSGLTQSTDGSGHFFYMLPTGTVSVIASTPGYYSVTSTPFAISLNATTDVALAMTPIPLQVWPASGCSASVQEGVSFTSPPCTYWLTNACLNEVTWTATTSSFWLNLSATNGVLPAGSTTALVFQLNNATEFLSPGVYSNAVTIDWSTPSTSGKEIRSYQLNVSPWQPPVLTNWNFNSGLPAEWTIIGEGWSFSDPGNRGNLTGGTGIFAIADSDFAGSVEMDTQLRTAPLSFADHKSILLNFKTDFRIYSGSEIAAVDISTNGSTGPWHNLWQQSYPVRGPTNILMSLGAIAQSNNMIRFHYTGNYEYWWQVDDVELRGYPADSGALSAIPLPGLDAHSYAGDAFEQIKTYRLTNSSTEAVTWTSCCDIAWIDTIPSSGLISAGGTTSVTVRANSAATMLPPGSYSGSIIISNMLTGETIIRPVALDCIEPLSLTPSTPFNASGIEGGPFSPASTTYTLTNPSAHSVPWNASVAAPWLLLSATNGTIPAGSTADITASFSGPSLTTPGVYSNMVTFSNTLTGTSFTRSVSVTVAETTGRIAVYDSITPTNDLWLPFGVVTGSTPRVETITVRNTGETLRNLTISAIQLGFYQNSFDTDAAGWLPTLASDWHVTNGAYHAYASNECWMLSSYQPDTWSSLSAEVFMRRSSTSSFAQTVALRATDDFSPADGTGSAYLFLCAGNRHFSVFRFLNGAATLLQGWTYSSALNPLANRIIATASSNQLRLVINGTLVWEGTDSSLSSGHVALGGYTPGTPNEYSFDEIKITRPQPRPLGVGRKQLYFNSLEDPDSQPEGSNTSKELPPPGEFVELGPVPSTLSMHYFILTNLPPLPSVLGPNEELSFSVIYAPETCGTNSDNVLIRNNDNYTPELEVILDGWAAGGTLTGQVIDAYTTLPVSGATITITNGVNSWTATSGARGQYSLNLPAGSWPFGITVAALNYASATTNVSLTGDGMTATRNFELNGARLTCSPTSLDCLLAPGGQLTNWITFSNSGPLSASCSITLTATPPATVDWCQLSDTNLTIAPGHTQALAVFFTANALSSAPPAVGQAQLIVSGSYLNPLPPIPVTLHLTDDDWGVTPSTPSQIFGAAEGPFSPASIPFTLSNLGTMPMAWSVSSTSAWINLSATSGTLTAKSSGIVTALVQTNAPPLTPALYRGTLIFSNHTAGTVITRPLDLWILPARTNIYTFSMDTDPGWTTQGQWAFGAPQGAGSHNQDPSAGFTGSNVFGYNLAGDYTNDLPRRCLTTGPLNFSRYLNLELDFQRWLGVEDSAYDHAAIELSNDGTNWVELWQNQGKAITDTHWQSIQLTVPTTATTNTHVQFRWVMGTTDGSETYPGWNLDDVIVRGNRLWQLSIQSAPGQVLPATGAHLLPAGIPFTCTLTNTFVETPHIQYVYQGWTGSGDVPSSGTNTSLTITLTRDSTLTWLWTSNVLFTTTVSEHGSVSGSSDGWYPLGDSVLIWAQPDPGYRFAGWQGAPAAQSNDNPLLLELTQPYDLIANFEHEKPTLTIRSPHGNPVPDVGIWTNEYMAITTNYVPSPETLGSTQWACIGWTLSGNGPSSGTTNLCIFTHTNHAVLTWLWSTNYYLTRTAGPHGQVIGSSDGWYALGTPAILSGVASRYFHFTNWSGDIDAANMEANPLQFVMDQPRTLTAQFAENLTPNTDTPEWWLAQYGWTNNFTAAATNDADGDGVPTSDEYSADTSPTDRNSYLRLLGIGPDTMTWSGGSGAFQYVEFTSNLLSNDWRIVETNMPPTPLTNTWPITPSMGGSYFRIKATR